ncbi:MAG TPA: hypothetical protein DDX72_07910 [Ruminococcaceae bacterium]|nr:hypothetical protein [Oscillospiraceae bacterium]
MLAVAETQHPLRQLLLLLQQMLPQLKLLLLRLLLLKLLQLRLLLQKLLLLLLTKATHSTSTLGTKSSRASSRSICPATMQLLRLSTELR